jgi:ATP-dependent Clp protease adapter protein ClpS
MTLSSPETEAQTKLDNPWQVVLFNDEVHVFDEVVLQVQKALGCPIPRAAELTWRAHKNGKTVVFIGPYVACEHVTDVLEQIQLGVKLEKT